jgi:hypothetical protein
MGACLASHPVPDHEHGQRLYQVLRFSVTLGMLPETGVGTGDTHNAGEPAGY